MSKHDLPTDIFEDLSGIDQARSDTYQHADRKILNTSTVRKFVNGRDFLSTSEQKKKGIKEIVNFGNANRLATTWITPLESITLANDELSDVSFHTNLGPSVDIELAESAELIFNRLLYSSTRFDNMWRNVVGEGYVKGGVPLVNEYEDDGVIPSVSHTLVFPPDSPLDAESQTFAFEELEMDLEDLKGLIRGDNPPDKVNVKAIESLIETIESQIRQNSDDNHSDETNLDEMKGSVRDDDTHISKSITITAWRYWEIRTDDKTGQRYVSKIEYVERYNVDSEQLTDDHSNIVVLQTDDKAFKDADAWMRYIVFDEEIGGDKTIDTVRGVGELHHRPSRAVEELKNRRLEGALAASIPTLIDNDAVDPEEAAAFKLGVSSMAPKGFTDKSILSFPDSSRNLDPIIQDLTNTAAGIVGGDRSNTGRGQELRQQAVERQGNTQQAKRNRVLKAYKQLDPIIAEMFYRVMTIDPKPGFADYNFIKMFQKEFDEAIVIALSLEKEKPSESDTEVPDAEELLFDTFSKETLDKAKKIRLKLATKKYGYYVHMHVKINRNGSGIDISEEEETAKFLLEFLRTGNIDPQLANHVRRMIILMRTGKPDMARMITKDPEPIRKDQRRLAAGEWPIIKHRATTGVTLEVDASDVHEDHVDSHLIDAIGDVNAHGIEPWTQLRVVQFSAGIDHAGKHLEIMRQLPESQDRVQPLFQQFQEVVKQASIIIQELAKKQEENQADENDPKTALIRAQTIEVIARTETMLRKYGLDVSEKDRLNAQSNIRAAQNEGRLEIMKRSALVNEAVKNRQVALQERQTQQNATNNATTN